MGSYHSFSGHKISLVQNEYILEICCAAVCLVTSENYKRLKRLIKSQMMTELRLRCRLLHFGTQMTHWLISMKADISVMIRVDCILQNPPIIEAQIQALFSHVKETQRQAVSSSVAAAHLD